MDEQLEGAQSQDDEDVEGHLLKEGIAAAAVAGAMFAGNAQAKFVEPDPGGAQVQQTEVQKAPQKKHAKAPHVRQRNRADTIDG
jgi:hypothetical protein